MSDFRSLNIVTLVMFLCLSLFIFYDAAFVLKSTSAAIFWLILSAFNALAVVANILKNGAAKKD